MKYTTYPTPHKFDFTNMDTSALRQMWYGGVVFTQKQASVTKEGSCCRLPLVSTCAARLLLRAVKYRNSSSPGRKEAGLSLGLPVSRLPVAVTQLLPAVLQGPQAGQHVGPGTLLDHLYSETLVFPSENA